MTTYSNFTELNHNDLFLIDGGVKSYGNIIAGVFSVIGGVVSSATGAGAAVGGAAILGGIMLICDGFDW